MYFIETIAIIDGKLINREGHIGRMRKTAAHFGFATPKFPDSELNVPENLRTGLIKCRFLYNSTVSNITFEPYTPKKIDSLIAVETYGKLDYSFKYADRKALQLHAANSKGFDEVIFLNNGFITDTSFTNIVLRRGDEYITPETYLLNGTQREYLLKTGQIKESSIHISTLSDYDELILINAMLDLNNGLRFPIRQLKI